VDVALMSVIVCAHNEAQYLGPCLHSLLAQTRQPDEILVVNNASTDETRAVAQQIPNVHVVDEPRKGLVVARETGRREATGDVLVYVDADCRAPLKWLERIERHFERDRELIAVSAPYRFYDWDWWGRLLIRAYDFTVAPLTQLLVKHILRIGTIFYGGNFAVRRHALDRIGGFLTVGRVRLVRDCYLYTSARRYNAMGKGAVFRLYVRNFTSEVLYHQPKDTTHVDVRT
jgi:glycosyltransferase involved in cell wall biosynthesis